MSNFPRSTSPIALASISLACGFHGAGVTSANIGLSITPGPSGLSSFSSSCMVHAVFSGVCADASNISRSRISDRISRVSPPQFARMVTLEPLNTKHFLHRLISRLRSFSGIAQGFLEPSNSATDSGTEIEEREQPNFELIRKWHLLLEVILCRFRTTQNENCDRSKAGSHEANVTTSESNESRAVIGSALRRAMLKSRNRNFRETRQVFEDF